MANSRKKARQERALARILVDGDGYIPKGKEMEVNSLMRKGIVFEAEVDNRSWIEALVEKLWKEGKFDSAKESAELAQGKELENEYVKLAMSWRPNK